MACEGELGLLTEEGVVKPVLQEMDRIRRRIEALPSLPPRMVEAVCILNSTADPWSTAFGTFMLAKQAGFDIDFCFEDQALPDANFHHLPCVTGIAGVAKPLWEELLARVHSGASLYLSSQNGFFFVLRKLPDCAYAIAVVAAARWRSSCGGDRPVTFTLKSTFKQDFAVERAQVFAAESDGNPVLSLAQYGRGRIWFCSLPIKWNFTQLDALSQQPEVIALWRMYKLISSQARAGCALQISRPHVAITEHILEDGNHWAVLINHSDRDRNVSTYLQPGWTLGRILHGPTIVEKQNLVVPANDAVIVSLLRVEG